MCGIIGQVNREETIDRNNFVSMRDSLIHRGPDDAGVYFDGDRLALGHRRLSILDLSDRGRQPMSDEKGKTWITYNGEVYNFREIREELQGESFNSETDTEVILRAYSRWGIEKTLEKLNGMFAFCIYDKEKGRLICARDRVGIKPVIYHFDKDTFIISSEIKAILKSSSVQAQINREAVYDYFVYRYVANPRTIYEDTFKLEPGHYLEFDIGSFEMKKHRYWALDDARSIGDEEGVYQTTLALLREAVEKRLVADVEVSTFLSGGIDSSTITAIAKEKNEGLRSFSIDIQPEEYSEAAYAEGLANSLEIDLVSEKVGANEFREHLDEIIRAYDEPIADSSIIPTYLLCKHASRHVKVALSGDGGDEVFYGYSWYKEFAESDTPVKRLARRLHRGSALESYRKGMYDRFTVEEVDRLFGLECKQKRNDYLYFEKGATDEVSVDKVNTIDFRTFLVDDILYKVDTASMANSLEVRVPFLDHRLIEYLFRVDFKVLFKEGRLKQILKKVAEGVIPKDNIIRGKKGFSAPVMEWLDEDCRTLLLEGEMVNDGFLDKAELEMFLDKEVNQGKIWQLFVFEKWYRMHYKENTRT